MYIDSVSVSGKGAVAAGTMTVNTASSAKPVKAESTDGETQQNIKDSTNKINNSPAKIAVAAYEANNDKRTADEKRLAEN